MISSHHLKLPRIPATAAARATIWAVGLFGVTQGAGILIGGPGRWSSLGYTLVRQLPGGSVTWGVLAVAFGTLILVGSFARRWAVKAAGLAGLSVWTAAFGIGIAWSVMSNQTVGTTATPVNVLIAVVAAILITIDERKPPRT